MPSARSEEASLRSTPVVAADAPAVAAFAREAAGGGRDERERAVLLYRAVRDRIRYDPYSLALTPRGLSAETTLARGRGWCVAKAVLLAAGGRALGIPARLGFADVRNHLATERLRERMGTDVFYWHGYALLRLEGRWVKATPAFNVELCERFGIPPLDFDGRADALLHPFDREGRRHMEYLRERGEYDDVPIAAIAETFRRAYPGWAGAGGGADWEAELAEEREGPRRGEDGAAR